MSQVPTGVWRGIKSAWKHGRSKTPGVKFKSPLLKGVNFAGRHPFLSLAVPGLGLEFGPELGKGFSRDVLGYDDAPQRRAAHHLMTLQSMTSQARQEEIRRNMAMSVQNLASVSPNLFNSIMAGRKVPQDAVVLGGNPRTDLLEEVAMGMAQGDFGAE